MIGLSSSERITTIRLAVLTCTVIARAFMNECERTRDKNEMS